MGRNQQVVESELVAVEELGLAQLTSWQQNPQKTECFVLQGQEQQQEQVELQEPVGLLERPEQLVQPEQPQPHWAFR